jgi:S1-C subfamily serine protease
MLELYREAADSTACLYGIDERWEGSWGSGVLVSPRILLTCHHVVSGMKAAKALFPRTDAEGRVAATLRDNGEMEPCRIGAGDPGKDLSALVLFEDRGPGVPVAREDPKPGDPVFMIGCGGQIMWRFVPGLVQQTGRASHALVGDQSVDAEVVVVSTPSLKGDSGSPVLNGRGELVGLVYCYSTTGACSFAVGVREIRAFLAERGWSDGKGGAA